MGIQWLLKWQCGPAPCVFYHRDNFKLCLFILNSPLKFVLPFNRKKVVTFCHEFNFKQERTSNCKMTQVLTYYFCHVQSVNKTRFTVWVILFEVFKQMIAATFLVFDFETIKKVAFYSIKMDPHFVRKKRYKDI